MNEIAEIWQQLLDRDKFENTESKGKRFHEAGQALAILQQDHPDLYSGVSKAILTPLQAKALNERLKEGVSLKAYRLRNSFINSGLRLGMKNLNWMVVLLPRTVSLKREPPPFTKKTFTTLKLVRHLEESFLRDLEQPLKDTTAHSRLYGQLLLSAILYGGLLHTEWIDAWLKGIPNGIRSNGHSLWIEMSRRHAVTLMTGGGKNDEKMLLTLHRRWFADPLTEALIYRALTHLKWHGRGGEEILSWNNDTPPRSWGYLRGYLIHLGFGKTDMCKSQKLLLKCAGIRTALELPPVLAGYASGDLASVSLPPSVWTRLLSEKSVPVEQKKSVIEQSCELLVPKLLPKEQSFATNSMELQEEILREMRNALFQKKYGAKGKKIFHSKPHYALAEVKNVEATRAEQMCPIIQYILSWMKFLLASSRSRAAQGMRGRACQPSSVDRYLSAIGGVLLAETEDRDLREMSSDELSDMYEEAALGKRQAIERGKSLEIMARFHSFLVETIGLPLVTFNGVAGKIPAEASVNANLISPAMYRSVLEVLGFGRPGISRCREVAILLTILAFRCGMRDGEGRYLLISDIQGKSKPELLIRPNKYFRPKSQDGIRRIPLYLLLDPEKELPRLMEWHHMRRVNEEAGPTDLMFAIDDSGNDVPYSNYEVIEPVKEALRQLSGDQNIVFHNLRHSFATWLMVRLMVTLRPELTGAFPFLAEPQFTNEKLCSLRKSLLGTDNASRQVFFFLALVLGHSSPEVTIQRYIHLFDWLLWIEINDPDRAVLLNETAVSAVTQLSRSALWHTHHKSGQKHWTINPYLHAQREKWAKLLYEPLTFTATEIDSSILADSGNADALIQDHPNLPDWRVIQRIIATCQIYPHRYREQADSWGYSIGEINKWMERAHAISHMITKAGHWRHTGEYIRSHHITDGEENAPDESVPFPRPPKDARDIALVDRIYRNLLEVRRENRASLIAGVEYFLHQYNVNQGGVRVWKCCQGLRYLEFLAMCGISRDYVRLQFYLPKKADVQDCESRPALWANCLGIGRDFCKIGGDKYYDRSETESIFIKVVASISSRVKRTSAKKKSKSNSDIFIVPISSYGFRYAMYMAGILIEDCHIECGKTIKSKLTRWKSFESYLNMVFISKKYGKRLSRKGIQDAVVRCKRIEKGLGTDLDDVIDCQAQASNLKMVTELVNSQFHKFNFEGDVKKGLANLKFAAKQYFAFVAWDADTVDF